jgi:UDP-galactopyranose mutase
MNKIKTNNIFKYDYLIVGSGPFGTTFAHEMKKIGKKVKIIDKRSHIGGNIYTENIENVNVHKYGAHIFHTNNKKIWDYVNQFCEFNNYINAPVANYNDEIFNLPFNMNTFNKIWGVITPQQAKDKIKEQINTSFVEDPKNLEEQAINLVGPEIYEKLIKGYTEKQWGRNAREIPAFIIRRLPLRFTYDNNYFNDRYQGIPIGGYTKLIQNMLDGIEVELNTNFFENKDYYESIAGKILFTGMIDQFYDYKFGKLQYRSLRFENEVLDQENYQGNAVVNYTSSDIPYTRILEHKHFEFGNQEKTVITREFSVEYDGNSDPYYPINDNINQEIFEKYKKEALKENKYIFGGRLAEYKYYDMHQIFEKALDLVDIEKLKF